MMSQVLTPLHKSVNDVCDQAQNFKLVYIALIVNPFLIENVSKNEMTLINTSLTIMVMV